MNRDHKVSVEKKVKRVIGVTKVSKEFLAKKASKAKEVLQV